MRSCRKGFFQVRAQGLAELRHDLADDPAGLLIVANHSCWWDLYLAHLLNRTIPVDGYGMMEHFNLKRFGFFRRIGAFSVDRTDPAAVRASLDYTIELLQRPGAGVWLFPQGRIAGNDLRPLGFQGGLRALLRRAGRLRLVTAALRYEFWQEERPEAFVRFGRPRWVAREDLPGFLDATEHDLTVLLDALRADVVNQRADLFETILAGRRSISDRFGSIHARIRGGPARTPSPL